MNKTSKQVNKTTNKQSQAALLRQINNCHDHVRGFCFPIHQHRTRKSFIHTDMHVSPDLPLQKVIKSLKVGQLKKLGSREITKAYRFHYFTDKINISFGILRIMCPTEVKLINVFQHFLVIIFVGEGACLRKWLYDHLALIFLSKFVRKFL